MSAIFENSPRGEWLCYVPGRDRKMKLLWGGTYVANRSCHNMWGSHSVTEYVENLSTGQLGSGGTVKAARGHQARQKS